MTFFVIIGAIAITSIITDHLQKQAKNKRKAIKEELELEKLKHENFLLETDKLRLELEQRHQISEQKKLN
ncbi:hypothetical protein [Jeotgalibacillus proteolyticus]|uniref:Uncharacterized protein n=1 Tax=Jeotgalibacillus proteolyticus TaxID=2082395 RepID=A0A2S5G6B8_9BACL|nr:hypothetical protein [Jeotgalibacillus proteolyticus]PPA68548.1 hypothetical protein C4B60_20545 [Jeotgalibacillus proteolyticus]